MIRVDRRGESRTGRKRGERGNARLARDTEAVRRANLRIVYRLRVQPRQGRRNLHRRLGRAGERNGEGRRRERLLRADYEQKVRPGGGRRHPGVHAERTDRHGKSRIRVFDRRSDNANLRRGGRAGMHNIVGLEERRARNGIVLGLDPVAGRHTVEDAKFVHVAGVGVVGRGVAVGPERPEVVGCVD